MLLPVYECTGEQSAMGGTNCVACLLFHVQRNHHPRFKTITRRSLFNLTSAYCRYSFATLSFCLLRVPCGIIADEQDS